ncbi:hypothetical protein V498_02029 [Pseudogymnoascus sp. VKM F-4517 (FW-2822)]|nr:hypothetical protein V498_02029 [Pseudogymnoascus sp. VKM F-4517 (FW-2822)]
MNDVLMQYLDDFCTAYLDDILIYSEDPTKHIEHCEFNVTCTKYLGYILTTTSVEADPEKIEPLRNWTRPTTVTGGLYYFDPELPTKLETDASDGVVAGVLSQEHPDKLWYPEIYDKELFAIVKAFQKWRPELNSVRHRVEVYTDHRSLEYFMSTKVLTAKQVRWMELLADFNFCITPGYAAESQTRQSSEGIARPSSP